ncbi:MAG: GIY-YIG nuclease family protein [SAR86 cluster bacterium]|nr:GIY-YIG nuclease family protein [SAR86 cluster bacterium]HIC27285.1 GIY-YIG nuclease family protein [Gammaproteobacteria bacterium]
MTWYVYILKCGDDSLYTGITNNLESRVTAHRQGRGAKYTRGRGPFEVVYQAKCVNRSEASLREKDIKKLNLSEKLELISKV